MSYSFAAHDSASHTVKTEISANQAQALRPGQIMRVVSVAERPTPSAPSAGNAWLRFRNDGLSTGFFAIFLPMPISAMRAEFRFGERMGGGWFRSGHSHLHTLYTELP